MLPLRGGTKIQRRGLREMDVLLIGSGGREHAMANALAKSPLLTRLYVAPGNPGTARVGENVDLDAGDHGAVVRFCHEYGIALVVVGPEQPLIGGLVDALARAEILAFGPTQAAAQLEGSKGFAKDLCREYGIPTADYERFSDKDSALRYLREKGAPIVVKADGLAAGKGVVVAATLDEAERAVEAMLAGLFGQSGAEVVIEAFLEGEEASFFAICDGARAVPFATAQDHKRVGDGDAGPNTGGMGAYSPASVVTPEIERRVMAEIIEPTMRAMRDKGAPFRGVLYAGLMLTKDGPKLIEYNNRFGDPEAQAILPRLEDDLLALMLAAARGALDGARPRFSDRTALTVVLAARGYPGAPLTGSEIRGVERAEAMAGVVVTHAGTRMEGGRLLAAGGRVLNVTALAGSVAEAQARAYAAVDAIDWPGGFCRRDIGWREAAREKRRH
jgi:phosphoribosylamine--glycine ligase